MRVPTNMIKVLDGQNRDNSDKSIIQSVQQEGVLVPLLVYDDGSPDGGFVLVAGHRRLASAIHFGLKEVPVVIIRKEQAETARALENLDRKGLHPLDEAMEIRTLQAQGYDNSVISAMLGMELPRVIRRSKLNNLDPAVKQAFLDGKINAEVAEELSVMDGESQAALLPDILRYRTDNPKLIREMYLARQGLKLDKVSEQILGMEPKCAECPHNMAAEDPLLFPGTMGNCRDPECYCKKICSLMERYGAESIYAEKDLSSDEPFCRALKENGVKVRKIKHENIYINQETDSRKVLSVGGFVRYWKAPEKKKTNPAVAETRKKLRSEYEQRHAVFCDEMGWMMAELADSWYQKNHKGEPMPDKDERTVLAKKFLQEFRYLKEFLYGEYGHHGDPVMEGADNRRIFSVVMLYCLTKAESGQHLTLYPSSLKDIYKGLKMEIPYQMSIEENLQLKTSRHRKRAEEAIREMMRILKEYKDTEDL